MVLKCLLQALSKRSAQAAAPACRANVAFQLSRLNALLLRACRLVLKAADYDALVLGEATGVLVEANCIEAGMILPTGKPCILLVDFANGDEEVRLWNSASERTCTLHAHIASWRCRLASHAVCVVCLP